MGDKTYTRDEVKAASLEYFGGDEMAADVFVDKYALQINDKYVELTPADMHRRLATEFARIEAKYPNPMSYEQIYELFDHFKYVIPAGSPMSGIGNVGQIQSLSNCFCLPPPHDSYGGILKNDQELVQITKRRGGVGFDISTLRPRGLPTSNAAKTTDGIGVFMQRYSNSTQEAAQHGRRGALLLSISVHHPEIKTFINIKRNKQLVNGANISIRMTDEFMNAVQANGKVQLRFPVERDVPHDIEQEVDARELWNDITKAMRDCSEPGLFFWDKVLEESPADCYADVGYATIGSNPCLTGDTLVAVADGRGFVAFKELAESGLDVPVYTRLPTGSIAVRCMRNPRKTGNRVNVYEVLLDDGSTFKCTGNHKLLTSDDGYVCAQDLKPGTSLATAQRYLARIHSKSANYWHLRNGNRVGKGKTEHRLVYESCVGPVTDGDVIHHVDRNPLNNSIQNLVAMDNSEHSKMHCDHMFGENNPIHAIMRDPVRRESYHANMSASTAGLKNPRAFAVTNDEIQAHAIALTKQLNHPYSPEEWVEYATTRDLPKHPGKYRNPNGIDLRTWAAQQAGFDTRVNARLYRTSAKLQLQGFETLIKDNHVFIKKICMNCQKEFWASRCEQTHCSHNCAMAEARKVSLNPEKHREFVLIRSEIKQRKQLDTYTSLRFELHRDPTRTEWEERCIKLNQSYRIGSTCGFESWSQLVAAAQDYNHRVVSVTLAGKEDVYNGTVDETHNYFFGGFGSDERKVMLNCKNCGELIQGEYSQCILLSVNLSSFVENKFTPAARFDFDKFFCIAASAHRLADDLIDLEIEAVERIIDKVTSDPEPEDVKAAETNLWQNVKQRLHESRRVGLGITALSDAFAMLGMRYGDKQSIEFTSAVYRELAHAAYTSSCTLAGERGVFPIFDRAKEQGHPFIERILQINPTLRELYDAHGRRNIANLTTAPTGTTSIMTQTTPGIEPPLYIEAVRRRKLNDANAKADIVDDHGDRWQVYKTRHKGFDEWCKVTGKTDPKDSPYWGATLEEIDGIKKIDVQAAAQEYICHSVSNTCNFPENVTVETVEQVAWHAWETKCKGITVYRKNSREDIISDRVFKSRIAPTRPQKLECDIYHATIQGAAWTILVGLYEGLPYEIFGGLSNMIEIPKKYKKGWLIKRPRKKLASIYDLQIGEGDDKIVIRDVIKVFDNPTESAFTRMISLALRHGTPVNLVVEQLLKDEKESDMFTFTRVAARVLKAYIEDGTHASAVCPQCGSSDLVYREGCVSCSNCPYTLCG